MGISFPRTMPFPEKKTNRTRSSKWWWMRQIFVIEKKKQFRNKRIFAHSHNESSLFFSRKKKDFLFFFVFLDSACSKKLLHALKWSCCIYDRCIHCFTKRLNKSRFVDPWKNLHIIRSNRRANTDSKTNRIQTTSSSTYKLNSKKLNDDWTSLVLQSICKYFCCFVIVQIIWKWIFECWHCQLNETGWMNEIWSNHCIVQNYFTFLVWGLLHLEYLRLVLQYFFSIENWAMTSHQLHSSFKTKIHWIDCDKTLYSSLSLVFQVKTSDQNIILASSLAGLHKAPG